MDIQSSDYIDPENLLWRNPESLILSQSLQELLLQALSTRFKIALDVLQRIENGISEDMLGTHKNILKKSRK